VRITSTVSSPVAVDGYIHNRRRWAIAKCVEQAVRVSFLPIVVNHRYHESGSRDIESGRSIIDHPMASTGLVSQGIFDEEHLT
jgi:hypothetical protein